MVKENAWCLLLSGNYEQAFTLWDAAIADFENSPGTGIGSANGVFSSRGYAHLHVGNAQSALLDFVQARIRDPSFSYENVGVALWLLDKKEEACLDWSTEIDRMRSGKIHGTDAGGGVITPSLLWWASLHADLGEWRAAAEKELRRLWNHKGLRYRGWPRPVSGLLLKEVSVSSLIEHVDHPNEIVRSRDLCQAYFYIAASQLAEGDLDKYADYLKMVVDQGEQLLLSGRRVLETEYFLAKNEVASGTY